MVPPVSSELLINAGAGETRIALVEDGVLQAYRAAPAFDTGARAGDIYLGRVTRVMPAMQAAFVDIGEKKGNAPRDGFLSLRDAPGPLHEGAAIAVRVTRAAMGEKGAKLTARITLSPDGEVRRKMAKPPARLETGPDPVEQALRAWKAGRVLTDDPRLAKRLKIELAKDELFIDDLGDQIALLSRSRVPLPCGGWITIEKTEGLSAIDVNSGGFAASGGREETARIVNLEAAHAMGRQIRLRGIGGLIVADFIQMEQGAEAVVAALRADLARDAARSEISPMNAFGLVAIARQRLHAPHGGMEPCAVCGGSGERPGAQAVALEILRAVERGARAAPGREITVRAAPEVADWLVAHAAEIRAGLDRRGVGRVQYLSEPRNREDFDVAT